MFEPDDKDRDSILDSARHALIAEAEAVEAAARRLGDEILRAVDLILTARGRLIVSGMGKSGLVGHKISATLSSTGTPSFFLHPAEALHGDLGMVTEEDVMLLLSNSGETDEVIRLIPFIRRLGARIIAIVGNMNSSLANAADVVLDASVVREACPMNLAPTSSTTVAMALGDALAIALIEARGFREKDFAYLHPSGSLGRRFLTVKDLMHTQERIPLAAPDMPLKEAILAMSRGGFGVLVIVDSETKLLGVFTDGDLRRFFERDNSSLEVNLAAVMTKQPRKTMPGKLAMEALKEMESKSITSLPVVNEENVVVGFIHLHDILRSHLV